MDVPILVAVKWVYAMEGDVARVKRLELTINDPEEAAQLHEVSHGKYSDNDDKSDLRHFYV